MKLQQGQVWQKGDHFIRLVVLERKSVTFKLLRDLFSTEGPHTEVSKKEFCRLIKTATLLPPPAPRTPEVKMP